MKVNIEKMFHILLSLLMDSLSTEFQVENDSPLKPLKALIRVFLCSLGLLVRNPYQQIINLFLGDLLSLTTGSF